MEKKSFAKFIHQQIDTQKRNPERVMFNEIPSLQQLRDKEQTLFTNYLNFERDEVKEIRR